MGDIFGRTPRELRALLEYTSRDEVVFFEALQGTSKGFRDLKDILFQGNGFLISYGTTPVAASIATNTIWIGGN